MQKRKSFTENSGSVNGSESTDSSSLCDESTHSNNKKLRSSAGRRKKSALNARERNLRRLESNEVRDPQPLPSDSISLFPCVYAFFAARTNEDALTE